uniref:C2 domain-containing protein n=1 Tax=Amphimedon queenslandica TaxID=400682 RepID=A0A1X7TT33_AMPQE
MATERRIARPPRHVNVRTQQRRLRHVRSLAVRSLKPPEPILWDPLAVKVKFTLYDLRHSNTVLYTSSVLEETYNPTWRSLTFQYEKFGDSVTINKFKIKVWLITGESKEEMMCFEKIVDLSTYRFMGVSIGRLDNLNYPSNSVVVATAEGYYCNTEVGGLPRSPHFSRTNQLVEYLPRNSLIEVSKSEVGESCSLEYLNKMLDQQQRLTSLREKVKTQKAEIQATRLKMAGSLKKKEQLSRLKVRVELLKQQLAEKRETFEKENKKLVKLQGSLNERETTLKNGKSDLLKSQSNFDEDHLMFLQRRDQLIKTQRQLYLRQRTLISELSQTFCIQQMNDAYTICDVALPNGDPLETGSATVDQIGVAFGYVAHLVYLLSEFLLIPLHYPIVPLRPKATIIDNIHVGIDIKEFPLYVKGTEKALYLFGLYLLWRDILQIRQHCGYNTSKSTIRRTLPNLKGLLDKLMMDKYSIFPLRESSHPVHRATPSLTSTLSSIGRPPLSYMDTFSHSSLDQDDSSYNPNRPTTPILMDPSNGSRRDSTPQDDWNTGSYHSPSPRSRSSLLVDNSKAPILRGGGSGKIKRRIKRPSTPPDDAPFQLSESPSRKTIYMVDVPRPLSNTISTVSEIGIEESLLPASLPVVSLPTLSSPAMYSTSDPMHLDYVHIECENESESRRNGSESWRNGSESQRNESESRQNGSESRQNGSEETITDVFSNAFGLEEISVVPEEVVQTINNE